MNVHKSLVGILMVIALLEGQSLADYRCPPWPPEQSPFWKDSMTYQTQSTSQGLILVAVGTIGNNESLKLERAIRKVMNMPGGIYELWLNSPGGNSVQGVLMGRVLRKYGVATRIPSGNFCVSACTTAFLGGPFRAIENGGVYALHMFSAAKYRLGKILQNKNRTGAIGSVADIEQETAKYAAERYQYILEMGVSPNVAKHGFDVKNKTASCPPVHILQQWNVVNSD